MWSDNGTTFVGASRELQQLKAIQPTIAEQLEANGTEWHFIPPHSPNFGGLWEAGVKSTKFHLKRVIGDATLTYEELTTLLSQIEACLNSRPMSTINVDDPGEPMPLKPGHFLIGEPLANVPDYGNSSNACYKSFGDVGLTIKEDDLPPSRWLMGRIVDKHPGDDNITRVVT
ncbi:uncharacterized protein LOC113503951 [Trichoplusia ni]|uniref:Uncharacterized protein LOC113503951 n=1 Tax=Trichoplusia ni TaxID=7111 RepID=A0A7E5WME6_TRINI|nr:uncharacterized protein LOC113503951 [Trichoplusia ni]